ncbi:hypothetical protein CC85DRAFT_186297 [Cutaneotrichosporon oleaginosum]|uniref:Uncharacterized protein n=1 Tax=Cutaneotrichosporon oleaginosum TaxID=879819 RepID=A0A0J0XUN6_9TREE|nr:uncharacterized protein CC85DRAFT_186297 [Cutaneotrichosporon oleaginosum]KLT44788.1 hypothetical protein CC85DRAFT_186297 [Cutaneotrichosporon oleaginosum]TXT11928.1 hypothetical protein COLE_02338 [Cutaneotrichosporon oleaginosum]
MPDSPRDRRREYSPLGTVTVFRTATAAGRTGAQWRDRGPLEFACHLTDDGVRRSGKMAVGVVRGQGVLVAADEHTAHLINLDTGNRTSIALERVDTIDSPLFSDRNLKDKEAKVWSVNITDEYVFVVTQYQVHIFTHIGEKLAAYPDPCADYLAHAGLGFGVEARYPYGSLFKPAPKTPASAPPGFSLAWTLQWTLEGAHPDSHEFAEATEGAFAYPSEWDDDHSDDSSDWHLEERFRFEGMNAWLQDVSFTTDDLVIRGRQGGIFIVRDYRRVLREVRDVEEYRERTAYIGRHTVVIGFRESNDVVACYGNRIAVHAADVRVTLWQD